jgi:hypothetical protein
MDVAAAMGLAVATIAVLVAVATGAGARVGVALGAGAALGVGVGVSFAGFFVGAGDCAGRGVGVGVTIGDGVADAIDGADGRGVTGGTDACASGLCARRCGALEPPKKCASTPPNRRPARITTTMSGKTGSPLPEGSSSPRRRRGGSLPFRASTVRTARREARRATP